MTRDQCDGATPAVLGKQQQNRQMDLEVTWCVDLFCCSFPLGGRRTWFLLPRITGSNAPCVQEQVCSAILPVPRWRAGLRNLLFTFF